MGGENDYQINFIFENNLICNPTNKKFPEKLKCFQDW